MSNNFRKKYALETNKVLVIRYDVAHPPPVTAQERRMLKAKGMTVDSLDPSVVGVSCPIRRDLTSMIALDLR